MSKAFAILIVLLLIVGGVWFTVKDGQKKVSENKKAEPVEKEIKPINFYSQSFKTGENIPVKYTCLGENISPNFRIENVETNAKSLVIIVDDPDAPKTEWVHLAMWNIDPKTSSIAENALPKNAVIGKNDFGQNNYGGPCPSSGQHRYFFKLYSLDIKLNLTSFAGKAELLKAMEDHIIGYANFYGIFKK